MKKFKSIVFIIVAFIQVLTIAQSTNSQNNCDNQFSDELHICRINLISKECNRFYLVNSLDNSEDLICLNIFKEVDWFFFIDNISKFKNIKNLAISKIKIENFDFLLKLPNLEILYISSDNIKNYDSFISNMNQSKVHILTLKKVKGQKELEFINQLKNIKTLGIYNSKINTIEIKLKLDQLYVSNCRSIKNITIPNVINLSLVDSKLKCLPKGLSGAQNLQALSIKQNKKILNECNIYGYKSLKYLNLISVPSMIEKECFLENNNIQILKISF